MENEQSDKRIAYVNERGLDDKDIQRAVAGFDHVVPISSQRLNKACNYMTCGVYKDNPHDKDKNISRVIYSLLGQSASYIRNGRPHAEAILITGKEARNLANVVEVLGLPHIDDKTD